MCRRHYENAYTFYETNSSGPFRDDELVIVNLRKIRKVNVLIKEYCSKKLFAKEQNRFDQVLDILKNLASKYQCQKKMDGTPKDSRIISLGSETTGLVKHRLDFLVHRLKKARMIKFEALVILGNERDAVTKGFSNEEKILQY